VEQGERRERDRVEARAKEASGEAEEIGLLSNRGE
jgi:hypothetical protein